MAWIVWGFVFLFGLIFELHTILTAERGDTLTENTRRLFFVHTKPGRAIFVVVWLGFSTWFLGHILDWWP